MFEPAWINIVCVCIGAILGIVTWRGADKKTIAQDATWKATVNATLKSVNDNTQRILDTLDLSDARIGGLERDVARLQSDVKTLFNTINKKEEKE